MHVGQGDALQVCVRGAHAATFASSRAVPVGFECGIGLQVLLKALCVIRIALLQAEGEQRARFK